MDSIVAKGMLVREFKKQIVKEAYDQGIEFPLHVDRCSHEPHVDYRS